MCDTNPGNPGFRITQSRNRGIGNPSFDRDICTLSNVALSAISSAHARTLKYLVELKSRNTYLQSNLVLQMATGFLEKEIICDVISTHIREVFDRILSEVKKRRDKLLAEVYDIRQELEVKNAGVVNSLKELEGFKSQLTDMVFKQNKVMNKQQESITQIDQEIQKLKLSLRGDSKVKFKHSLDNLMQHITGFGEILTEYQYSSKLSAIRVIDRYEDTSFGHVNSVHIDHERELFYVVCGDTERMRHPITVFNANDFQFIREFGNIDNPPHCFVFNKDFVYTASVNGNVLLQYIPLNGCIAKTNSIPLDIRIFDISVNSDNQLFVLVLSGMTFKILTYDKKLSYKRDIHIKIGLPWCDYHHLSMQLLNGNFYISYNYERLLQFNREGKPSSFFRNGNAGTVH